MKLLTLLGLLCDLIGVGLLGVGAVMKGAAALRALQDSARTSFHYDVHQRPWYVRGLLVLGATLGAPPREAQRTPLPYRAFPLTVYGFTLLLVGLLLQVVAALWGAIHAW
jgi:hypothetical protein